MKQKIYEIPLWEAFEIENCECPLCAVEKKSEDQFIETLFTEMVMDVNLNPQLVHDFRFCHDHFEKLYKYPDKCGLAILCERIFYLEKEALNKTTFTQNKKSFFKKTSETSSEDLKCLLCEKLDSDIENYTHTLIKMWHKNEDFKKIFGDSRGFCLKHYKLITSHETADLDFKNECLRLQEKNLDRLHEELKWFVTKFDYRFKDEPWKTSKDALLRTIQKLVGNFDNKI